MPSFVVSLRRELSQNIHIVVSAQNEGEAYDSALKCAAQGLGEWKTCGDTVMLDERGGAPVREIEEMEESRADLLVQMLQMPEQV